MAIYDLDKASRTSMDTAVDTYEVSQEALDYANNDETFYDFIKSKEYLGYYKKIPELKKAVDALAMWTAGKGYITELTRDEAVLQKIRGWGEDTFQSIMKNLIVIKKIIGDSFAEIIKNDKGDLINLKPISPERVRIVCNKKGMIKRYEIINVVDKKTIISNKIQPKDMLHLCNDRVADEIHGTSVIEACKWVIDARNEAMTDYRKVLHRNVIPVRIIEIDTDDTTKRDQMISEYEDAINKGEVLVLPKGTAEIKDNTINIQDPSNWIRYLENFFYQAVGIPKIILGGSEEFTEASSKVGYLTFEQVYMSEQTELEADIWAQLAIKIKFNRPVSLKENMKNDEAANTGQVGFQPKEAGINMERE